MDELTRLGRAAACGDADAAGAFIAAGFEQVWRLCASLVDPASADDLAQETFARAVAALPRFRGDASGRTWLLRIARNTCVDELRSRHRRRRPVQDGAPVRATTDPGEQVSVDDLLRRIDPDRRAAFVLTQMIGLAYAEAAEVCGCPVGTIRSRVARARADLLDLLADRHDDRRHA